MLESFAAGICPSETKPSLCRVKESVLPQVLQLLEMARVNLDSLFQGTELSESIKKLKKDLDKSWLLLL